MTTQALPVTGSTGIRTWLRDMWHFNWPLTLSVLLCMALVPIYLVAAIVDPRIITGAPAFVKPLKFVLSFGIYLTTFLWLLSLVQGKRRLVATIAVVTGMGALAEIALITLQAARGVTSHYNHSTPLDATLINIMAMIIVLVAFANLGLGILLLFQRLPNRATAWAIRLGVLITFIGMIIGFLMTSSPSPAQHAKMAAGEEPTIFGAHSVGVEDGGPGLPFMGWSTEGGDLRVAHFFGLHAMQALPLLALALTLSAVRRRTRPGQRTAVVLIGGLAYLGWIILLTWQALRSQPVLALDMLTASAYALLLGITAAALLITLWPRSTSTSTVAETLG